MGVDAVAKANGPLGSLVDYSLDNYKYTKEWIGNNKTLGPRFSPIVNFAEEKVLSGLKKSPIQVEDVVSAVDSRVESVVSYSSAKIQKVRETPGKIKNNTFSYVHDKLSAFKSEGVEAEESKESGEVYLSTLIDDATCVTAESLNKLLDASEGYLQQYLPPSEVAEEGEEEDLVMEGKKSEIKPVATRAYKLSKVAVKRAKERTLSRVEGLKLRTKNVVHVDLMKYSEWLDKQTSGVKDTIFINMEKLDQKVVQPTKERVSHRVEQVQSAVGKTQESIQKRVITPAKERIIAIKLPFHDQIIQVWTTVGDAYNEKIVKPREQIIQMFREELQLQQELAKQKNGDEQMTIQAGLAAVVAAARLRLSKEWEIRISPTLQKFMGKSAEYEEEEEEKSFGDAEDGEEGEGEEESE